MIQSDTQRLARADLELRASDGRGIRRLRLAAAVVVPMVAIGAALYLWNPGARWFMPAADASALAAENALLRAAIERARAERDIDQATRKALNHQAEALNDQINELTNRLEFLTARNTAAADAR